MISPEAHGGVGGGQGFDQAAELAGLARHQGAGDGEQQHEERHLQTLGLVGRGGLCVSMSGRVAVAMYIRWADSMFEVNSSRLNLNMSR